MEKQFNCSRDSLKKARATFCFYVAAIPVIAVLFLIPFALGVQNRIEWQVIIYILLAVFFVYQGYRAYCVLRAAHHSYCRINGESVSGISTKDPYQKGIPFQICANEITRIEETIIATERKENVGYAPHTLHRPPFESPRLRGYQSTILMTENASYTLFGITMTDEVKEAFRQE